MRHSNYCTQCGNTCDEFEDGVCADCAEDNQYELDLHNTQFDYWEKMTTAQREAAIKFELR